VMSQDIGDGFPFFGPWPAGSAVADVVDALYGSGT
jgi:hypothetical protein